MKNIRVQVASDLHEEFTRGSVVPLQIAGDVLVLAGDIHTSPEGFVSFLRGLKPTIPVIYVLGNHDYYGRGVLWETAVADYRRAIAEAGFSQVHLLEDSSAEIHGVRFLGSTLWTGFGSTMVRETAENNVADFTEIVRESSTPSPSKVACPPGYVPSRQETLAFLHHAGVPRVAKQSITGQDVRSRHEGSKTWLFNALSLEFDGPTVVVTHFAPSVRSNPVEYSMSRLTRYFCNTLDNDIRELGEHAPVLWIHGHTHGIDEYKIGEKTLVVSNQRGYPGERDTFDPVGGWDIAV